ncbi:MAG: TlyA family RNA methyltransferase [Oribacterium sp.]|nr:TlyA family RNA methyltransferase [Oribacterium sp.]
MQRAGSVIESAYALTGIVSDNEELILKKERLDVLLVNKGLSESREKAKRTIMAGIVYVNGEKEDKAGTTFDPEVEIEVRGNVLPYVSRGGLKLEKAIKEFGVSCEGKVCLDIGASTGGFTDCMLQNGAVKVFAIDVGHGQLDWKLRNDERVVCMEKTNIRYVKPEDLGELASLVSIDVSFISLQLVLPVVKTLIKDDCQVVCLIKPQFEAGRDQVGKKGVVRDKKVHVEVIEKTLSFAYSIGFELKGLTFSPIKGPEGNIEYLAELMLKDAENSEEDKDLLWIHDIAVKTVDASHDMLDIK